MEEEQIKRFVQTNSEISLMDFYKAWKDSSEKPDIVCKDQSDLSAAPDHRTGRKELL
ncbi:MAG: hypothetical protein ACLRTA_01870 [Clostridia bacterium]